MKKLRNILIFLLGASAITSSIGSAIAVPYKSNMVYKVIENGETRVYVSAVPNNVIEVNLGLTDRFTSRVAGACGEIRLSSSSVEGTSLIQANSSSINLSTLTTQLLPSCNSGNFAEARTSHFKTPDGQIVLVGFSPNQAVTLNIPRPTTRRITANDCGFAVIRSTSSVPLPASFKIGSDSYTVSILASTQQPPLCRSGQAYIPAAWASSGGSGY